MRERGANLLVLTTDSDVRKAIAELPVGNKQFITVVGVAGVLSSAAEKKCISNLLSEIAEFERDGTWSPGQRSREQLQDFANYLAIGVVDQDYEIDR
jgi:hypothetical protein